jgi:hypothetical protein
VASANCGVGRELPDAFAVIQLKLGCTPTGAHVPRMLTIIRRSAQGATRDRTDISSPQGPVLVIVLGCAVHARARALL